MARVSPIVATPSPGIGSPLIRRLTSSTVARVSPIVATPSPGIGSPLIRRVTSPTVTVPKSPTVTSPAVTRISPTVASPDIGIGSLIIHRPRRVPGDDDEKKRKRYPWEEWFISYRSEPTPHAGLESAYLRMPDVARPGTVSIKRLQRITSGPAPARTVTPIVKRGRVQVPVFRWGSRGRDAGEVSRRCSGRFGGCGRSSVGYGDS